MRSITTDRKTITIYHLPLGWQIHQVRQISFENMNLRNFLAILLIPSNLFADLVINEVLFDPAPGNDVNQDGSYDPNDDEFIEIVNTGPLAVDLTGYQLADAGGDTYTFPSLILRPLEAVVLFHGGNPPARLNDAEVLISDIGLNNDVETITFSDNTFNVIQTVSWASNSEAEDQSLNRDPDLTGNFAASSTIAGFSGTETPGLTTTGQFFDPSIPLLELSPASATINESGAGNTADITVTLGAAPDSYPAEIDLESSDLTEASVPASILITSGLTGTFTVSAIDDDNPDGTQALTITATSPNYRTTTIDIEVDDDADTGTLLSSPILITQFHEGPGDSNYIEFTNVSDQAVDLTNYIMTGWVTADTEFFKEAGNIPRAGRSLSLSGTLQPGNSVVLTNDRASTPLPSGSADFISDIAFFNGDDSMVLYRDEIIPANIADAISFTNDGNEGTGRGFVRRNKVVGYDLQSGTSVRDYDDVWEEVNIEDVENASPESDLYLGTSALGQSRPLFNVTTDRDTISESGPNNSTNYTITLSEAPASYPVIISFSGLPSSRISLPPSVEITNGLEATFTITGINDTYPNGDSQISIGVRAGLNLAPANFSLTVLDDGDTSPDSESPILFTQLVDGPGDYNYIELSNISNQDLDLEGYIITSWNTTLAEEFRNIGAAPFRQVPLSGVLPAGGVLIITNAEATALIPAGQVPLVNDLGYFNGDDSFVLYLGEVQPSDIVDAITFTDAGNEGRGIGFVRSSIQQGYDLEPGTTVLDFGAIWVPATIEEIENATSDLDAFLGTSSLAGSIASEALAIISVQFDPQTNRTSFIVRGIGNKTWQLQQSSDLNKADTWSEVPQGYSRSANDDGSETIDFSISPEAEPKQFYRLVDMETIEE